jgi:uncharacterized Zn finger protein
MPNTGQRIETWRKYRVWTSKEMYNREALVDKTHANEKDLRASLEWSSRRGSVPLRNQFFDLLEMDLVPERRD